MLCKFRLVIATGLRSIPVGAKRAALPYKFSAAFTFI